jgi:hypothetical protein
MEDFISNWKPKQISSVNLLHYELSSFEKIAEKKDHPNTKNMASSIYLFFQVDRKKWYVNKKYYNIVESLVDKLILDSFRGQFWSIIR